MARRPRLDAWIDRRHLVAATLLLSLAVQAPLATAEQEIAPVGLGTLDAFGTSVSVDGDLAIFGSPGSGTVGRAWIYRFDGDQWREEQAIEPSVSSGFGGFGSTVVIRDDLAVVGVETDNGSIDPAFIYRYSGSSWLEEGFVFASDGQAGDQFGRALAVIDGRVVVGAWGVGVPGLGTGAFYTFEWTGVAWSEVDKTTTPISANFFGIDLAADASGASRMLVGSAAAVTSSHSYSWNGAGWTLEDSFGGFDGYSLGRQVALDGTTAALGAVDATGRGGVCVLVLNGAVWEEDSCFGPAGGVTGDGVGGQELAVLGNRISIDWSDSGRVITFVRDDADEWRPELLSDPPIVPDGASVYGRAHGLTPSQMVVAASNDSGAGLGAGRAWAVELDYAGERLLVGTPESGVLSGAEMQCDGQRAISGAQTSDLVAPGAGAAYVFASGPLGMREEQTLLASDAADSDRFGVDVALAGDVAVVGAYLEDSQGSASGAAYAYWRTGATWGDEQKLKIAAPQAGDQFGNAVAMDGDTAVVAAHFDDSGATNAGSVTVYRRSGTILDYEDTLLAMAPVTNAYMGRSVDIDGDVVVAGAPNLSTSGETGSAHVFRRLGSSWSHEQKLEAADGEPGDDFGGDLAVSGDLLVVAASLEGAVYPYRFVGTSWIALPKITAPIGETGGRFGFSVALDGGELLVGLLRPGGLGEQDPGSPVFRYLWDGATFGPAGRFDHPDGINPLFGDGFGWDVDVAGDHICISAPMEDLGGNGAGIVYRFDRETAPAVPVTGLIGRWILGLAISGVVLGLGLRRAMVA